MKLYVVTNSFEFQGQQIFKGQLFLAEDIYQLPCDEDDAPVEFYSEYMAVAKKEN